MGNMINRDKVLMRLQQFIDESPYRTKTEFCQAAGFSPQVLGNIQNPKNKDRDIPKSILQGLARLGCNLTWLLHGAGDSKSNYKDQQEEIQSLRQQVKLLEELLILKETSESSRRKQYREQERL
jgi:hypothetical protein